MTAQWRYARTAEEIGLTNIRDRKTSALWPTLLTILTLYEAKVIRRSVLLKTAMRANDMHYIRESLWLRWKFVMGLPDRYTASALWVLTIH